MQALLLSPRALFCRPEAFFVAPRRQPRGPSALARLGRTGWGMSPRALFCHPEAFFVAPSRQPRGPSALARLGRTKRKARLGKTSRCAVPKEVRDAVPREARDASLSLGRTKNGGSAGQGREGTFKPALNTKLKSAILGLFFRIEKVKQGEKRCQKITTKS